MTIMAETSSVGIRRCDARCHSARSPSCDCICGGRYHGTGSRAQSLLMEDIKKGMLEEAGLECLDVLQESLAQGTLW